MYTSADETKEAAKQRIEFIINLNNIPLYERGNSFFVCVYFSHWFLKSYQTVLVEK